ncbi:MAG: hypothetical protein RJA76_983 [Bacteroidota bacterium]|jgi:putative endonuclease
MFVTYVLFSEKFNKIYIGFTNNLITRFHSHNQLATKGFTIKYRPWKVLLVEFFDTKKEACIREKQLKSRKGREFIKNYIGFISVS